MTASSMGSSIEGINGSEERGASAGTGPEGARSQPRRTGPDQPARSLLAQLLGIAGDVRVLANVRKQPSES